MSNIDKSQGWREGRRQGLLRGNGSLPLSCKYILSLSDGDVVEEKGTLYLQSIIQGRVPNNTCNKICRKRDKE